MDKTNAGKTAINTKTGTQAVVLAQYRRISDGISMVYVQPLSQMKPAYWRSDNVEIAA